MVLARWISQKRFSSKLAKKALAVKINGAVRDLDTVINEDSRLEILTFDNEEGKKALWAYGFTYNGAGGKNVFTRMQSWQ